VSFILYKDQSIIVLTQNVELSYVLSA